MFCTSAVEMRVLILAPIGRDGRLLADTLAKIDVESETTTCVDELNSLLAEGAGTAMVADEALGAEDLRVLADWLFAQPAWSDLPVIILTGAGRPTASSERRAIELAGIGNVSFLERPVRPETVKGAVRTALRARMRQYEIRSRQEALVRANADLEQFAHSASHDLREPLRSIGVYGELLARDYGGMLDERGIGFLHLVRESASRMEALLNDLLCYAHASSIQERSPEPVEARVPLDIALRNLASAISESCAAIGVDELPAVRMRESHLAQLFQNLVGNAIKYRREEPLRIHVGAQRVDGYWIFRVDDNGIGIPDEYKETIFGIFQRLHTSETYSGTGMGLAICQRIVERYRGRIWVESEVGRGSSFRFTVPA